MDQLGPRGVDWEHRHDACAGKRRAVRGVELRRAVLVDDRIEDAVFDVPGIEELLPFATSALREAPTTAPIELETLASAWHMHLHDSLVPLRNGIPDPGIPPLLHWLILGGWQVNGILVLRNGLPFHISVPGDIAVSGSR
mgnify:CR=1 FL=1